jgi:hypothetical protein
MGDPSLFEDLSSNNRASTQTSFGHNHPLPRHDYIGKRLQIRSGYFHGAVYQKPKLTLRIITYLHTHVHVHVLRVL